MLISSLAYLSQKKQVSNFLYHHTKPKLPSYNTPHSPNHHTAQLSEGLPCTSSDTRIWGDLGWNSLEHFNLNNWPKNFFSPHWPNISIREDPLSKIDLVWAAVSVGTPSNVTLDACLQQHHSCGAFPLLIAIVIQYEPNMLSPTPNLQPSKLMLIITQSCT